MKRLYQAACQMKCLLNCGCKRQQVIEWVGNRYQLDKSARHLLNRSVFASKVITKRRLKKKGLWRLKGALLGIDGHNVIITVESALKNRPLVLAQDGFIRDIAGISASYQISEQTFKAIHLIARLLAYYRPQRVDWFFDAPLSKSRFLAQKTKEIMVKYQIPCQAQSVPVPEKFLVNYPVVATSDGALIDVCPEIIDLAGEVIKFFNLFKSSQLITF